MSLREDYRDFRASITERPTRCSRIVARVAYRSATVLPAVVGVLSTLMVSETVSDPQPAMIITAAYGVGGTLLSGWIGWIMVKGSAEAYRQRQSLRLNGAAQLVP